MILGVVVYTGGRWTGVCVCVCVEFGRWGVLVLLGILWNELWGLVRFEVRAYMVFFNGKSWIEGNPKM